MTSTWQAVRIARAQRDWEGEKRRDMETVERIYAQMGMANVAGLYGPMPYAFGPDDARQAEAEREEEDALWALRLVNPEIAEDA